MVSTRTPHRFQFLCGLEEGTKRAAEALGRAEACSHAEGAREGASFLWGCTWTCQILLQADSPLRRRGCPRSPPPRGPRQAVYLTPATETPRCVVGLTVGWEDSDTVLLGQA